MDVTSREIMTALGIKNIKTLTRWHQQGLIPPPSIGLHPDGIGRMAYWPEWVMKHCRIIKQLMELGHTSEEVARTFGGNWQAIAARYGRYNLAVASVRMDYNQELYRIRESIFDNITNHWPQIQKRIDVSRWVSQVFDVAQMALELLHQGHNPVLIVSCSTVAVVPDFVVSFYLARNYHDDKPMLIVPLFPVVSAPLGKRRRKSPQTQPVAKFVRSDEPSLEQAFTLGNGWEFEIPEIE